MGLRSQELPEPYRGQWCDRELAERNDRCDECGAEESDDRRLKSHWARALLSGDLKRAHKLWGKRQGFTGNDPWEDDGWRRFWELQRMGDKLWTRRSGPGLGGIKPKDPDMLRNRDPRLPKFTAGRSSTLRFLFVFNSKNYSLTDLIK